MAISLFPSDWKELWGTPTATEGVGAIFTKPHVVEFMLDIAGYIPASQPLRDITVMEPSCGDGAFLESIVARLIDSEVRYPSRDRWQSVALESAIAAIDLDRGAVDRSRTVVETLLRQAGCPESRAAELAEQWIRHDDFLLAEALPVADLVVGNPPYVRLEHLPKPVLREYRDRFSTLTDRSDLYVAFYERALSQLSPSGCLSFITANRFVKNQYGRSLRRFIARHFRVRAYLNLEHTKPFLTDVSAYPAILLIDRQVGQPTRAVTLQDVDAETLVRVRSELSSDPRSDHSLSLFQDWYGAGEPWLTTDGVEFEFLRMVQEKLPTLEASAAGTVVGIGVATGADSVFVLKERHPQIEVDRLLPLVMARDIAPDGVAWSGHYLVNPFAATDDGSLVDLADYPGLRNYLTSAGRKLRGRHVALARPQSWYRTIDRIWPTLVAEPKLVIPDIQSGGVVAIDSGSYYPHHNVYWIKSDGWPLGALQALLRSTFVRRQISATSVQMRGGSLRYQAQSLRRVRIPHVDSLSPELLRSLAAVGASEQQPAIDRLAARAYQLPDASEG